MVFCFSDHYFTGFWAVAGSMLGFFAFRRNPDMCLKAVVRNCALSVGVGLLIAFPITEYLQEVNQLSKRLSMMLGAIGAFGLPDFILRNYPKLTDVLATKIIDKVADKSIDTTEEVITHVDRRSKQHESDDAMERR